MDVNEFARTVGLNPADISDSTSAPAAAAEDTSPRPPAHAVPRPQLSAAEQAELEAANAAPSTYATPLVRKTANQHGIRLADLTGRGAGGRITVAQVREAAGLPAKPTAAAAAPRYLSAATATRAAVTRPSQLDPHQTVTVDDYGANPLAEEARVVLSTAARYSAAVAAGDTPPTLFPSGNAPVYTASGVPVAALAALPWPARIPAAHAASQAEAAHIINYFTPGGGRDPQELATEALMLYGNSEGNREYLQRIQSWLNQYVYDGNTDTWVKSQNGWGFA